MIPYPFTNYLLPNTVATLIGICYGAICLALTFRLSLKYNYKYWQYLLISLLGIPIYFITGLSFWFSNYMSEILQEPDKPIYFILGDYIFATIVYGIYYLAILLSMVYVGFIDQTIKNDSCIWAAGLYVYVLLVPIASELLTMISLALSLFVRFLTHFPGVITLFGIILFLLIISSVIYFIHKYITKNDQLFLTINADQKETQLETV